MVHASSNYLPVSKAAVCLLCVFYDREDVERHTGGGFGGKSLLRGVVSEFDTLLDIVLEASDGFLQQSLLLGVNVTEDVDGLLGTVGLRKSSV